MGSMQKLWFKAKRYGWGWYPCSWQGWAVLLIAVGGLVSNVMFADKHSHSMSDALYGALVSNFVIVVLLLVVCFLTGEKPRWRWGGKSQ